MQEMARKHILYLVMNKKKLFDMNKLKTAFLSLLCIALAATSLTSIADKTKKECNRLETT